jgi:hypothetical protein
MTHDLKALLNAAIAKSKLGDAPIEQQYRTMMNEVAEGLDRIFNGDAHGADRKTGFVLLVYKYGDNGRCNFISNGADRRDVVCLFKEMIARFEGQPEAQGTA